MAYKIGYAKGLYWYCPIARSQKKRGCSAMVEQHPKPSYSKIMRELGIEIISPNNSPLCQSDSINIQKVGKTGIKIKDLQGLKFVNYYTYFLRYRDNHFYLTIISQKREKGVFYS